MTRIESPERTKVEKVSWGWFVTCTVCGATDGFEARTSGKGALRRAKAWRCPARGCNEIRKLQDRMSTLSACELALPSCKLCRAMIADSMKIGRHRSPQATEKEK